MKSVVYLERSDALKVPCTFNPTNKCKVVRHENMKRWVEPNFNKHWYCERLLELINLQTGPV